MDALKDENIVTLARERFKAAEEFYSDSRELAIEDTKFAMGDSDNNWQWPDEAQDSRVAADKVCLTVNVTAQHCNQIINNIRQNRPAVKVSPVDDYADIETANILGGLIRNIQVSSAADDAHDTGAEHSIYGGEGYWRILTEYEDIRSDNQVIVIKPCPNPNLIYIDPTAQALDRSDAEYGFIFEDVTKEEFQREYPGIDPESWESSPASEGWHNDKSVRIAEYFYCEYVQDELYILDTGETILKSEVKDDIDYVVVKTRPVQRKEWKWCKLVGGSDEPVDKKDWVGDYLPIISVVGKEVNVDGEIVRKGVVRDLKDPARMVNYSYSETVQTLAMQNTSPYIYAAESIEGHEEVWQSANLDTQAGLPYNAFDADGNPLPPPSRQVPPAMATAQIQLLELSTEQMRAASGQQNANFGIKSEAVSGVGIQRLKAQGETATFHFPDNLARALRYEAVVVVDLIQKIYDTERVVRILGLDGAEESARLNPRQAEPYLEQKDDNGDIQKIFNPQVGRYDVVIDIGPSYHTQRQEAAANLNDLAAKNPNLLAVAGDIIMRAQDFPMADEMAERLERTIPAELKTDGDDELPAEAQQIIGQANQQMQEMDAVIQKLGEENEQLKQERQAKVIDNAAKADIADADRMAQAAEAAVNAAIDKFKAETDRLAKCSDLNRTMTDS